MLTNWNEKVFGLRRTHEADKRRQTEAETKGEMSRFRAFQTRINQGFFGGCQRVRDTLDVYKRQTLFSVVR